jgi:hypothetical protein
VCGEEEGGQTAEVIKHSGKENLIFPNHQTESLMTLSHSQPVLLLGL